MKTKLQKAIKDTEMDYLAIVTSDRTLSKLLIASKLDTLLRMQRNILPGDLHRLLESLVDTYNSDDLDAKLTVSPEGLPAYLVEIISEDDPKQRAGWPFYLTIEVNLLKSGLIAGLPELTELVLLYFSEVLETK